MVLALPEGYVDRDRGRWRVVALRLQLAEMTALLESARGGEDLGTPVAHGRGGTRRVTLGGGKTVYVRRYLRGGLARWVVRDRFLLRPPRPLRELVATEKARAAGVYVPMVLAVAIEERGASYRGWIVTSAIEGVRPFIDVFTASDEGERRRLLAAAGSQTRDIHDAGVHHPDLTGHNLLVDQAGEVATIDFDRATVVGGGELAHRLRERGMDRLWRSLSKLAAERGFSLADDDRRWLERGYAR